MGAQRRNFDFASDASSGIPALEHLYRQTPEGCRKWPASAAFVRDDLSVPELDPHILEYYDRGREVGRLTNDAQPSGPLELVRTQELIGRHLGPPPLEILDVGGGPGVYAGWLAEAGYHVGLVDPVPLHVEQAARAHPGIRAQLGDARALQAADRSVDAILLLGPLYHLVDKGDRLAALGEAGRVLRPGGILFAAAISRYAAALDLFVRLDRAHEPLIAEAMTSAARTGVFNGYEYGLFTTAYFHHPSELAVEIADAGFEQVRIFNIEGPGFLLADFETRWNDPLRREAILRMARLLEDEPTTLGASSHLLAVAIAV